MSRIRLSNSKRKSKIGNVIYNHIINNKREYLIVIILFFIGLISSIIYINNTSEEIMAEIDTYISNLFNNIKNYKNLDLFIILKESIISNIIITLILWFGASTIIGIPIVYGTVILKGFSIGYTISALMMAFGIWKGIILAIVFLILHNIILIPTIFAISVSGVNLYKSIIKNKERENIKLEILRHTIFCMIMLIFIIISSIIEAYISTNIGINILNYIKI